MRVAILDDYQDVALALADWSKIRARAEIAVFNHHVADPQALAQSLQPFDVVVIMRERTPFRREQFAGLPNLKLLVTTGMRNASVDLEAATEQGVTVCGTDGSEPYSVATVELTWALILAAARDIPGHDRSVRTGGWQLPLGTQLRGKILGVIGLGKLGERVAGIGRAFGMEVIAWSQNLTRERCADVGARFAGKDELLANADIVTIHLVLSERTRGLVGAREFQLMKPGAFLVNTSRGPIVDSAALAAALNAARLRGAAVDVYDVEPLATGDPLRQLPRSVLTPHIGYVTDDNYREFYRKCADDVAAWLDGKPIRVLNPDVLAKAAARA